MYWANFLHIYQPPTQTEEIVRKVTKECYRPLVKILKKHRNARVTLNINACLTMQLIRYGFADVIEGLGQLAQEGRVELTGSAMFHPILPLIPRAEMRRQIELNQKSNEHYFKGVYSPKGFFPPEMCYSHEMAKLVMEMGFEWIIIDEIACNGRFNQCQNNLLYQIESLRTLKVFFKERKISTKLAFGCCHNESEFVALNKNIILEDRYLLTGTDGEVYGHHHPGLEALLKGIFESDSIKTCTISQLNNLFFQTQTIEPLPSSWSTGEDDMKLGVYYPQWNNPSNEIHQYQWQLIALIIEGLNTLRVDHEHTDDWQNARCKLDEGLHSCQWWWASCKPWWGTDMVRRGTRSLMLIFVELKNLGLKNGMLEEAEKLEATIDGLLDEWDATGKARRLQEQYLDSHREISSLLKFS